MKVCGPTGVLNHDPSIAVHRSQTRYGQCYLNSLNPCHAEYFYVLHSYLFMYSSFKHVFSVRVENSVG